MAGSAQLGLCDVQAPNRDKTGDTLHDPDQVPTNRVRAEGQPLASRKVGINHKAAAETVRLAEASLADLVTQGTRDAVHRQGVLFVLRIEEALFEDPPFLVGCSSGETGHRHVAGGAFILDDRLVVRVVKHFRPDGRLPVGVAGGVSHHR